MILYHGSDHIIEKPQFKYGLASNDYGQGFYCTEHLELAKEWAATAPARQGIVNCYELDVDGLKTLNLEDSQYSVLNWLAVLVSNRMVKFSSPIQKQGQMYLTENFNVDLSGFDIITGYRADDSYFRFVRAFLSNTITVKQLSEAMRLGELGIQYVLKSQKSFKRIHYISHEVIDSNRYYEKRSQRNNEANKRFEIITKEIDIDGLFLNQIIKERIRSNDPRL